MHFKSCVCACPNKLGILSPYERGLHVCMGISKWVVFQLAWAHDCSCFKVERSVPVLMKAKHNP